MERLTEKLADGRNVLKENYAYVTNPKHGSFIEGKAVDKLAEYEQAEEDGLLIRLPCKAGSIVYQIYNNTDDCGFDCDNFVVGHCCNDYCEKLNIENPNIAELPVCEKQFLEVIEVKTYQRWILAHMKMFNKTVFLTKAEAEQALAKMKGE